MRDLLSLRGEHREAIESQINGREDALNEIDILSSKRSSLVESISAIQNGREGQGLKELRDETRNVEMEIRELETRLLELKARHRHLVEEVSLQENAVEAKLSSYKASMSLVENNIKEYLQNLPIEHLPSISKENAFYVLNPNRRTLEMADTQWKAEETELKNRRQEVNFEIDALGEGSELWEQVILRISDFEKLLKKEMRRFIQTESQLLQPDKHTADKSQSDAVSTVLWYLEETIEFVGRKLEYAQMKGWNLLVCCIGAELEALDKAWEMLSDTFNVSTESPSGSEQKPNTKTPEDEGEQVSNHRPHSTAPEDDVDNPEPPDDLLRDTGTHSENHDRKPIEGEPEPDPAWLLPET